MGLGHREYHPAEDGLIHCKRSRYIPARGPRGVLESRGKSEVDRARPESFTVKYGTTQSDIAVQDTER